VEITKKSVSEHYETKNVSTFTASGSIPWVCLLVPKAMSNVNSLRESTFGQEICGPKMLLVAVISQAIEDLLSMRRAGVVEGLTPIPEKIENSQFDRVFVLETCEFFGKSLETLLEAGGFTISASTIRRGVKNCPNDSKLFQIKCLRAEKTEKKEKHITSQEMHKALNQSLYGQQNARDFGMRRTISNSYLTKKHKNHESTEIE
jgi:hypothetical protein